MGLRRWHPSQWASLLPNGMGMVKLDHYNDILNTFWANRDQIPFAWRILKDGSPWSPPVCEILICPESTSAPLGSTSSDSTPWEPWNHRHWGI